MHRSIYTNIILPFIFSAWSYSFISQCTILHSVVRTMASWCNLSQFSRTSLSTAILIQGFISRFNISPFYILSLIHFSENVSTTSLEFFSLQNLLSLSKFPDGIYYLWNPKVDHLGISKIQDLYQKQVWCSFYQAQKGFWVSTLPGASAVSYPSAISRCIALLNIHVKITKKIILILLFTVSFTKIGPILDIVSANFRWYWSALI